MPRTYCERLAPELRAIIGLHTGGRPTVKTGAAEVPVSKPTLADAGIDKKLSARSQKLAALPAKDFDAVGLLKWPLVMSRTTRRFVE